MRSSLSLLVNSSVVIVITIITIGANGYKFDDDDIIDYLGSYSVYDSREESNSLCFDSREESSSLCFGRDF